MLFVVQTRHKIKLLISCILSVLVDPETARPLRDESFISGEGGRGAYFGGGGRFW